MPHHRLLPALLACNLLTACQWVDSTGTQSRTGSGESRFAPVLTLTEETPGQLDFTGQLAPGSKDGRWRISEEGILPACIGIIDPSVMATSLEDACSALEDSCEVIIIDQSEADTRYTLIPPRLSSPVGMQFQWDFDNAGTTETYDVTLCINAVNEAPIANDDAYFTHASRTLEIAGIKHDKNCANSNDDTEQSALMNNDRDDHHYKGPCLVAELMTLPAYASNDFTANFSSDGGFSYTPSLYESNTHDSFTYRVFDGERYSEPASVTLEISRADTRPVANFDIFKVGKNSVDNHLDVLENDDNSLPQPLKISAILVAPDSGGSAFIQSDQSISYTPAAGYRGMEYFAYSVENALGETDSAWAAVRVR